MEAFLNPNKILDQLELRENMLAAEFGSGSGGWVIPLAKRLEKGKVWAFDIQPEKISALEAKMVAENILNIQTKVCDLEESGTTRLPDYFLDLVLIPNVLFQAEEKDVMIGEAKRILKHGGQLLVVDWLPGAKVGPKEERVSQKEVKEMAEKLGLNLKKEFKAGIYHYGLIFEKQ